MKRTRVISMIAVLALMLLAGGLATLAGDQRARRSDLGETGAGQREKAAPQLVLAPSSSRVPKLARALRAPSADRGGAHAEHEQALAVLEKEAEDVTNRRLQEKDPATRAKLEKYEKLIAQIRDSLH